MNVPQPGLYRTTKPYPGHEEQIPENALVFVGANRDTGLPFVVRPGQNRLNRWYWGEPTIALRAASWGQTLIPLPPEGFYTLPDDLVTGESGRWLKNAIVQLGYTPNGQGVIFVAERHDGETRNALLFGDSGMLVDDGLLQRLIWAPILPVTSPANQA